MRRTAWRWKGRRWDHGNGERDSIIWSWRGGCGVGEGVRKEVRRGSRVEGMVMGRLYGVHRVWRVGRVLRGKERGRWGRWGAGVVV